jgi:acetylglutamate kinase
MDALITEVRQLSEELGMVGQPVQSDPRLLNLLMESGYLPVVACVGGDREGRFYNVNADQMAASVAVAIHADKLLFLTDVDGVRGRADVVCPTITVAESEILIRTEVATGGMRAKLEAATAALRQGVGEVTIAPGACEGVISKVLSGSQIGTRLVAEVGVPQHG